MKLHEILDKLGDKISNDDRAVIWKAVDGIKAKAKSSAGNSSPEELDKLKQALKEKEETLKATMSELKPFKEKEAYKKDLESFKSTKKAKADVDLSNYNYKKFSGEDGQVDWDKFLEANPHLKADEPKPVVDKTLEVKRSDVEQVKDDFEKIKADSKLANL